MTKSKKRSSKYKEENKLTSKQLQSAILNLFRKNPDKRYSTRQIIDILGVSNNRDSVAYALEQLELNGKLAATKPETTADITEIAPEKIDIDENPEKVKRFDRPEKQGKEEFRKSVLPKRSLKTNSYEGVVDTTKTGAAYIICQGLEKDIFVPQKKLNGALHGDKVRVQAVFAQGRRPDGEVLEILKRASDHFIGTLVITRKFGIVMPDRLGMPEVYVALEDTLDAEDGDKVVVKITEWLNNRNRRLMGQVTAVLGAAGSNDIEMKSILINNGFNIAFPDEVLAETAQIKDDTEGGGFLNGRRDFRHITTFTIDPTDAKDFDDALSFERLDNGNVEIGVHIADVSHYVRPNTALDKEAYLRSTSVYLVDRVCPMLPERLSNELCSLRPHETKMTFSAVFEFDDKYKIVNRWFGKTVIYSDRRFTYDEAQEVLSTGEGDFAAELLELNKIAYDLRKKRFKNGAINFETEEVKFKLDEDGFPIEVYVKERKDAHLLIEDFMLLANKEVATFIAKKEKIEVPFVYRIHDEPDLDKLNDLAGFALVLGLKMKMDTPKNIAKSLNDLMAKAEKNEALKVLTPLAIRCMAKAEYSSNNIGHYGLGFEYYGHFTSPIRRYSDVLAHRILEKNLDTTWRTDKEKLEDMCKHISKQERKAAECERESVKYKQVEYMSKRIGEVFEGVVSGIIERGFFVEVKGNRCEGMISFERMPEPFEVATSRLQATGLRTGKILKMGEVLRVKVVGTDLEGRKIDFRLLEY